MSNNKLFLKDYIGKNDINLKVCIDIKGLKLDDCSLDNNIRLLKKIYAKVEKGNTWIYIKWEQKESIIQKLDDTEYVFHDCGYSAVMLDNKIHVLDNLYLNIVK